MSMHVHEVYAPKTHAHEVHAREKVHAHEAQARVTQLTSADTKPSIASARLNCFALSDLLVSLLEVLQRLSRSNSSVSELSHL
jgi:hypothetical protein